MFGVNEVTFVTMKLHSIISIVATYLLTACYVANQVMLNNLAFICYATFRNDKFATYVMIVYIARL